ncbi:MAG: type II toxin-antitoxin system Phd/YefM family antitoxin [Elusimicrobia bacterium]|nr:type II toxin-antitoxin system Phd/YefM family antitoxin [Elusimicrobiota bacterium]
MDKIIPISDLQSKARLYVDQVRRTEEPVVITQRGRAAAVLVSYEAYEGFLATRDEMSFTDWAKRLGRARRESAAGKGMPLESYLRRRGPRA